jgi:hypothetical protein
LGDCDTAVNPYAKYLEVEDRGSRLDKTLEKLHRMENA